MELNTKGRDLNPVTFSEVLVVTFSIQYVIVLYNVGMVDDKQDVLDSFENYHRFLAPFKNILLWTFFVSYHHH
jgi:hypothetical protein